jgi:hypothetical protein
MSKHVSQKKNCVHQFSLKLNSLCNTGITQQFSKNIKQLE